MISFAIVAGTAAFAIPAVPWKIDKQLANGEVVSYYLRGNEKVHWMESPDGYTLSYDDQQEIVYAEQDGYGDMVPSQVRYTATTLRAVDAAPFPKGLRYSPAQVEALLKIWEIGNEEAQSLRASAQKTPVTGSKKALCLLVGFPDRPFKKTKADFEQLLNQEGYRVGSARGSVKDFYRENSYGKMDLTVTVAGPYTAGNPAAYYAKDNNKYTPALAEEVARKANNDIDFKDFAESGELATFHIIFAGYGAEQGSPADKYIWSHKYQLNNSIMLDNVRISVYSCTSELQGTSGTEISSIGSICHELCHVFGSPDYYDSNGATGGEYKGAGVWDLMASGSWNNNGNSPAHINMFQKIVFGWVTPTELTTYQQISNMPNSAENDCAYTYKAHTNGEMYVLENRQKKGFDAALPGHGLLIWHVHRDALSGAIGANLQNATAPQQLYPVVASSSMAVPNTTPASYGDINSAGAPFPGTSGNTNFTSWSTPRAFSWTGMADINKPITAIEESADGKISFVFMDLWANNPDEKLKVTGLGSNIQVKWDAPSAYSANELTHANSIATANAMPGRADGCFAVRFAPSDLTNYPGFQLSAISYGVLNASGTSNVNLIYNGKTTMTYSVCVWQGRSGDAPETLVREQAVPDAVANFSAGWHTIELTEPVLLDTSKDLWFGIRLTKKQPAPPTNIEIYPLACDKGPRVVDKGNWVFMNNTWGKVSNVTANWALKASVKPTGTLQTYTLARNGTELAVLPKNTTEYLDTNVPPGVYEYRMVANYSTFDAGALYGHIAFGVTGVSGIVAEDDIIQKVVVYSLSGTLLYRNNAVNARWQTVREQIPHGTCIVQITTQQGVTKSIKYIH
ncbi:M6 family metalloprotease domain protein [Candidatus Symbiothrix dinenymphae]|nr:M6 family metalloprotease domain protein [Candidatus Symbiothrix dinenymphae]